MRRRGAHPGFNRYTVCLATKLHVTHTISWLTALYHRDQGGGSGGSPRRGRVEKSRGQVPLREQSQTQSDGWGARPSSQIEEQYDAQHLFLIRG
jgi:hypothetical protein